MCFCSLQQLAYLTTTHFVCQALFQVFQTFWIVRIVWFFHSFRTLCYLIISFRVCQHFFIFYFGSFTLPSDSYGNRTRVTAVKGRCLNRLTKEPLWKFACKLSRAGRSCKATASFFAPAHPRGAVCLRHSVENKLPLLDSNQRQLG